MVRETTAPPPILASTINLLTLGSSLRSFSWWEELQPVVERSPAPVATARTCSPSKKPMDNIELCRTFQGDVMRTLRFPNLLSVVLVIGALSGLGDAQKVSFVRAFNIANGQYPSFEVLTQGRDGSLYGTTA